MTRADFAAMADPEHNRQFRRRWDEPDHPPRRERRSSSNLDPLAELGCALRDELRGVAA